MATTTPSQAPKYRTLPVDLTDTERMARAMRAAEKQAEFSEIEERKKSTASELGAQVKQLRADIEDLQLAVRTGRENQKVQIETRRNESRRTIETLRLDTFEIIDSRPMTVEERQGSLFVVEGGRSDAAKSGEKTAKAEARERTAAKAAAAAKKSAGDAASQD